MMVNGCYSVILSKILVQHQDQFSSRFPNEKYGTSVLQTGIQLYNYRRIRNGQRKKRRVKGAQLLYGRGHMNYQLAIRTSSLATPEQLAMATGPTALVVLGQ